MLSLTWADLPKKILEIIFNNFKRGYCNIEFDLVECALVCRAWTSAAQEVLFSHVALKGYRNTKAIFHSIACKPYLASFVKSLDINVSTFARDEEITQLETIANLFPHIEVINFNRIITDDLYYELFFNLLNNGKFVRLKQLPSPSNTYQDNLLAAFLQSYGRERITTILLNNQDREINLYFWQDILSQLSKLKTLSIHITDHSNGVSVVECIEVLILPTLEELEIYFHCLDNPIPLIDPQPMLNVKKLVLHLLERAPASRSSYIRYIFRKFPNLKILDLNWLGDWRVEYSDFNNGTLDTFLFDLLKLTDYSVKTLCVNVNNLCNLVQRYIINAGVTEELPVHLILSLEPPNRYRVGEAEVDLVKDVKRGKIYVTIQVYERDYRRIGIDLLEICGHHLDELTVTYNSRTETDLLLKHISEYCIHLKLLDIDGDISTGTTDAPPKSQNNLKTLLLSRNFKRAPLPFISVTFPFIEKLVIICNYSDYYRDREYDNSEIMSISQGITHLNLANFSVKHLVLDYEVSSVSGTLRLQHFYIKLYTAIDRRPRYYHIMTPPAKSPHTRKHAFILVKNPTKEGYKSSIGNMHYIHYNMICKSTEKITIHRHRYGDTKDYLTIDLDISKNPSVFEAEENELAITRPWYRNLFC